LNLIFLMKLLKWIIRYILNCWIFNLSGEYIRRNFQAYADFRKVQCTSVN
jgi:hypothetical protein